MLKGKFLFCLLTIFCFYNLQGQNLTIELKREFSAGKIKFHGKRVDANTSYSSSEKFNYSLAVTGKVFKFIYLKSSIGTNDYYNNFTIRWYPLESSISPVQHLLIGNLDVDQNYVELTPEIRLRRKEKSTKNFSLSGFFNIGIGVNQIRHSEFIYGIYRTGGLSSIDDKDDFPDFEGNYKYLTYNLGISMSYKTVGCTLEYGARKSETTKSFNRDPGYPGIGLDQKILRMGITYSIN